MGKDDRTLDLGLNNAPRKTVLDDEQGSRPAGAGMSPRDAALSADDDFPLPARAESAVEPLPSDELDALAEDADVALPLTDTALVGTESADAAPAVDYEELRRRLNIAENSAEEAQMLYKRMAADFENFRKRVDRERQEFLFLGLQKAVESLFPALDDLDRAQAGLHAQMRPEDMLESLKLVFGRIKQSLEQLGVRTIDGTGQHFDPQFHEPVQRIETSEHPDGVVLETLRKGYLINNKVIRPALVNVAATPQAQDDDGDSAESAEAQA